SLLWHRARIRVRGLHWKPRDETTISAHELIRLDVYRAVALGLGMVDNLRATDFQTRGLLLALRVGEQRHVGRAIANEAIFVGTAGGRALRRAQHLAEQAHVIA